MNHFIKLSKSCDTHIGRGQRLYHVSYLEEFAETPALWSVKADSLFEAFAYALAEHDCAPKKLLQDLLSEHCVDLDGEEIGEILDVPTIASGPAPHTRFTVIALEPSGKIETIEITASSAFSAFAVAAVDHQGYEFVAALPSWALTAGLVEFPGSALVDAETVLQQPEVFTSAS